MLIIILVIQAKKKFFVRLVGSHNYGNRQNEFHEVSNCVISTSRLMNLYFCTC
jgi:hypothetical protein